MEKLLPIGSIVYLKEGSQKLMVLNRGPQIKQNGSILRFDYSGCMYPIGLVADQIFYFNAENINEIFFLGFYDKAEAKFQELYFQWLETKGKKITKGKIKKTSTKNIRWSP